MAAEQQPLQMRLLSLEMKVVRVCKCTLKGPHRLIVLLSQPHIIKVLLLPWNFQGTSLCSKLEVDWLIQGVRFFGL